jgi:hypothetical protein
VKAGGGGFLIDTGILSALAPDRPDLPEAFAAWLRRNSERLYVPCIAVAEIEQGICKLRRAGGTARARRLAAWLDGLIERYAEHVLPLDARACRRAGRIADAAMAAGRHPGFPDVAIAALAQGAALTVLTRNTRHFAPLGAPCTDPFERLPA